MQVLLPPERIEIQPIEVTNKPKLDHNKPEEEAKKARELKRSHPAEPQAEPQAARESVEDEGAPAEEKVNSPSPEKEVSEDLPTLPDRVKESNQNHSLFTEVCKYQANPKNHDRPDVYLRGNRAENGLLYKDDKLWVAKDLRLDLI